MPGFRCDKAEDVEATLDKAFAVGDTPCIVDFRVDKTEKVFPMVPAGRSNDEIIESMDDWYARQRAADAGLARRPALCRPSQLGRPMKHTLSVLVENKPGVLARVAGLFSRRGFNIDSLAVGPTEVDEVSRMTIVVERPASRWSRSPSSSTSSSTC